MKMKIDSLFLSTDVYLDFLVNFLMRKIFSGNLNEVISLVEIDVTLKRTSVSTNEIASFEFPRKIFLKRKLTFNHFAEQEFFALVSLLETIVKLLLSNDNFVRQRYVR